MPNTDEKDKDKLYFYGESSKLRTFEKHAEDVVAKVGGEVLVEHLHNRLSEAIVRRKTAEQYELDQDSDGPGRVPGMGRQERRGRPPIPLCLVAVYFL